MLSYQRTRCDARVSVTISILFLLPLDEHRCCALRNDVV
jgi:hypothetical protein